MTPRFTNPALIRALRRQAQRNAPAAARNGAFGGQAIHRGYKPTWLGTPL